jgi:pyridoxine 4-dehydrogenase
MASKTAGETLQRSKSTPDAARSGTFKIGGELEVHRLGYGAMRITGRGIWGEPPDRDACIDTLQRLPQLGVNFIDTADSYGPDVSERLFLDALAPYKGLVIATKGGLTRPGPDAWVPNGRPEYLIGQAKKSLKNLGVDQIDLWQLHRIDANVPAKEQFGAIKQLLDTKIIRFAGLSEVSVADIEAASKVFKVASVQNRYNIFDRQREDVLEHCERNGIAFIPWFPLGAGGLAKAQSALAAVAARHSASTGQIALAWLLQRSPVMLPIPGTSQVKHLEENVAAADITLTEDDLADLEQAARDR